MQQTPLPSDSLAASPAADQTGRFIYIACPWSPAGGGMYKVADYLIRAQAPQPGAQAARLVPLDTRGPGSALASLGVLARALGALVRGRASGQLAGVHVNTAERMSLFRKGAVVLTARALGIPVIIHLHAQMERFYSALPKPLRAATRWVFSLAQGVVVIGQAPRRFVTQTLGVPPQRVEVVINGVPGPAAAIQRSGDASVRQVVFVGRLCEPKGVSDLLHALARAQIDRNRVQVTLAGNGDIEGYQALACRLEVDGFVRFAGWCEQAQVDALLRAADLLVLPSHDEVLPLVVLEALAHGVAVVCTPVGELPAVLRDGETACFTPVADVPALAATLERVLGDPGLLRGLGQRGRALYEQQFALQRFFAHIARTHERHFGVAGQLPAANPAKEAAP